MRQEIVDGITALGPCSIADLAEHLGRAADSLYFHVRKLVRVGLVQEIEKRQVGRHTWAIYAIPGRAVRIKYDVALTNSIRRIVAGAMRLSLREFNQAFEQSEIRLFGERRNVWGGRLKGWLTDDEIAEVNRLLEQLSQVLHGHGPGEGRRVHSLAFVLAPVQIRGRSSNNEKKEHQA
jgi:hypothetical protein